MVTNKVHGAMDSKTIRPIVVGAALFLGGCSFALDTLWPSLTGEAPAGRDQPAQQAQAPAQAPTAPAPAPAPKATTQAPSAPAPEPAPQVAARTPPQPETTNAEAPGATPGTSSGTFAGRRLLVVIRFDGENVAYEQALYNAVSRVLEHRPDATFELVAVAPASGGAAGQALSSDRTLRSAENVLRSLQGMGLPTQRVEVSAQISAQATTNEVHVHVN